MRPWIFRHPNPLCAALGLALLSSSVLCSSVLAQPAPSAEPSAEPPTLSCPTSETLLEVRVAGANRGTFLVRSGEGRTWLERSAFRQGEEAYFDAELRCDEVSFARLRQDTPTKTDLEQLTLSFEPRLELLGAQEFIVMPPELERLPGLPLLGLDYRVSGSANLNGRFEQQSEFRVNYTQDAFSSFAGLRQSLSADGTLTLFPYARVRYQADPGFAAQLIYNLPAVVGLGRGNLLGVQGFVQGGLVRYWSQFEFVLPLEANLRLVSNGQTLKTWRSAPGKVTLRNIPLEGNRGGFSVEIQDDSGKRTVGENYEFPVTLLPPGGYVAALEGGLLAEKLYGGTAFRFGLLPELTLEGRGTLSSVQSVQTQAQVEVEAQAELWAVLASPRQSLRLGLSYNAPDVKSAPFAVRASYAVSLNPFRLGVSAVVPIQDSFAPTLGIDAQFSTGSFGLSAQSSYEPGGRGLFNRLEANIRISDQLNVLPFVTQQGDNFTVGIGASFRPQDNLSAFASIVKPSGSSARASVGVQYQPDAQNQLSASSDFRSAAANYRYTNQFDFDLSVNTSGTASAQLAGSVALVGGKVYFSRGGNASRYVLLQTGVPDLPIYAEGQYQGSTNAEGNLVFALGSSESTQVRVDLDSLPIDLTVRQEKRDLTLSNPGTYVLDWRDNFIRSRFVEFRLDSQTLAARGQLEILGAEPLYLDDFGMGFLPVSSAALEGTLISEDGKQRCLVRVEPGSSVVRCLDSPP